MIKPASYWALHKTADAETLGRVGLALAGREGDLTPPLSKAEQCLVSVIRKDSEWMDESIAVKKKKVADAVKAHRERKKAAEQEMQKAKDVNDVMITPITTHYKGDVIKSNECNIPSLLPSSLPTLHNNIESESISAPARTRGDIPDLKTVITTATSVMGVPEYYARWWYAEMMARDWTNSHGGMIGNRNWRSVLKSWHNKATPEEIARIEAEAKTAQGKATKEYTADDWELCRETCANCVNGKCKVGITTPPPCHPQRPHHPRECAKFKAL